MIQKDWLLRRNGEFASSAREGRKWVELIFRPINKNYYRLLEGISQFLPDMNITVNLYDVPLVYTSREDRERLIALGESGQCTILFSINQMLGADEQSLLMKSTRNLPHSSTEPIVICHGEISVG
jgi:hypothetical protein